MSRREEIELAKQLLQARVAECLATPGGENTPAGGWTLKEMLAHVAFWNEAAVFVISYMLRDEAPPADWTFGSGYTHEAEWPRADVHNAREAAWGRSHGIDEVLERWERAYARLAAVLQTVTDAEESEHAAYFQEVGAHLREHTALIGAD